MIDLEILITGGVGIISTLVGSWGGWFFARKKYNAEVDSTKIENLSRIIDVLNELIKNLSERLDASLERNKVLEAELIDNRKELVDVRKQVSELMMKLIDLHIVPNDKDTIIIRKKGK